MIFEVKKDLVLSVRVFQLGLEGRDEKMLISSLAIYHSAYFRLIHCMDTRQQGH